MCLHSVGPVPFPIMRSIIIAIVLYHFRLFPILLAVSTLV